MTIPIINSTRISAVCLAFLLTAGCNRNSLEVVQVEGQITLGGGPWPKPGAVYFTPLMPAAGLPNRPAWGKFDTEGRFRITSFKQGDGLVPGKYRVSAECWDRPPQAGSPVPSVNFVPQKYQSAQTSDLEVTIESKQRRAEIKLNIPKT